MLHRLLCPAHAMHQSSREKLFVGTPPPPPFICLHPPAFAQAYLEGNEEAMRERCCSQSCGTSIRSLNVFFGGGGLPSSPHLPHLQAYLEGNEEVIREHCSPEMIERLTGIIKAQKAQVGQGALRGVS